MRKIAIAWILAMLLLMNIGLVNAQTEKEKSAYPTIMVTFSDGKVYNITGKTWGVAIIPYIEGRVTKFNWVNKSEYLFFDRSLKGLNPYGLDFVRAIEAHTFKEFNKNMFVVLGDALNMTANLDSDHDGYTNIQELNNGTYPGDPNEYPGKNEKGFWDLYGGYMTIGIIIASVFVLYFVFNREKES